MELKNWRLAYCDNERLTSCPKTEKEIIESGYEIIPAKVPGNVELDLCECGKLPKDIYFGENILEVQKWECTHFWYFTEFDIAQNDRYKCLSFEGIDTASEIYIDGELLATTENMLIPYEFPVNHLASGRHGLVVHIIPASIYSRDFEVDPCYQAMKYNMDTLVIRKAPYMYGWDIMCRAVSAGLWRPVSIIERNRERVESCYFNVTRLDTKTNNITVNGRIKVSVESAYCNYELDISGSCGESKFGRTVRIFGANTSASFNLENALLWWPKNYGEPNLYTITVSLKRNGAVIDTYTTTAGFRTIELERTSIAGVDAKFGFIVNGKPVFILGSNWVPTDAFPSRHDEFTLRGLEMVNDLGCNMIRCWGGNVYPSDLLYDYCDRHGIMVWQDFAMACGMYPRDERMQRLICDEAVTIVKKYRQHPSIALWSGDNECDCSVRWKGTFIDGRPIGKDMPSDNILTRKVIADVVKNVDCFRPYLPSSPYIDVVAEKQLRQCSVPEDHLWGPRDYFKGNYYGTAINNFTSETGYHGCPSPASLYKFIGKEHINNFGDGKACNDSHWLIHAANPEFDVQAPFAYRISLMTRQVERLFTSFDKDINIYAKQSQISQAEAFKFFIEHFRIGKPFRTGIIWWNIIDGWPQVSDAVVDWYGTKKLAYNYIKRSQKPFVLMFDEPDGNGMITLVALNESERAESVEYTVCDAMTGKELVAGKCTLQPHEIRRMDMLAQTAAKYISIKWDGTVEGVNHYVTDIGENVTFDEYSAFMQKMGFDTELEGF